MFIGISQCVLLFLSVLVVVAAAGGTGDMCRRYEGKYISYYNNVYLVRKCQRHEMTASVYEINKRGVEIKQVDAEVIRSIPQAKAENKTQMDVRSICRKLEKKYISVSFVDIYFVENCRRRAFPNWEAYQEHRRQRRQGVSEPVEIISTREIQVLPVGEVMPSVTATPSERGENISIAKTCKRLENKYVSFYRHLYIIKNCHKLPVTYAEIQKKGATIARELTTEQWKAIPSA